jgi:hypothetical protein
MDFKNFIDVLATPKNLGSNKWVLNNFSDLKSSNDYLHIIRLRYDNRWLRTYWDGKLKEVEKDYNFYVSTPIKKKLFHDDNGLSVETNLLNAQPTFNLSSENSRTLNATNNIDFYNSYERKYKDNLSEGSIRTKVPLNKLSSSYFSTLHNFNLDDVFSEYTTSRKFFQKNVKNNIKSLDDLDKPLNL